ncbi:MAG: polyprenyl synthetase family protein, partial [Burkholderiaceae bacterium]
MSVPFTVWAKQVQADMEAVLDRHLPPASALPSKLHQAMRYAVLDGGKRVRPLLVFAAGALYDAPRDALERAAAAVEMIHAYSLVHDDMPCMDDDDLRRGKPTVHRQYDEATALLVGDALQSQAFDVLSGGALEPARKVAMLSQLARAAGAAGMCGGQAIDLDAVGIALALPELEQMHRLKTGALLRASVLLGAFAGTMPQASEQSALDAYADSVGL